MAEFKAFFGETLVGKDGPVSVETALGGKAHVLVYFSAHWCPPCRGFTPVLAKKYSACAKDKNVEVVFVSSDQNETGFREYFASMPWLALPFEDRAAKDRLSEKFGVRGIPTLVVLDGTGNLVTLEGRAQFEKYLDGSAVEGAGGEAGDGTREQRDAAAKSRASCNVQ